MRKLKIKEEHFKCLKGRLNFDFCKKKISKTEMSASIMETSQFPLISKLILILFVLSDFSNFQTLVYF